MAKILVIEDEESIRENIQLLLKAEGYSVSGAPDGRAGLDEARRTSPDLVICDVMMPEMDGFAVLAGLRADPNHPDTPFIFLTALDDRANLRHGMNLGADDYLTKPFTRADLLEAVTTRLAKHQTAERALAARLLPREEELTQRFKQHIGGTKVNQPVQTIDPGATTGKIEVATVLFSDIRNFTTYSERLSGVQTAELLNAYFGNACVPVVKFGGRVLKFLGDGVMVLFEPIEGEAPGNHAKRAISAGLGMVHVAHRFNAWIEQRYEHSHLPHFAVGVGIHSGEVMMCYVGSANAGEWTAIGDSVNVASRLESQTKELVWPVIASGTTLRSAGEGIVTGGHQQLHLRGRSEPIEAFEIVGMQSGDEQFTGPVELTGDLRQALADNARITAEAAKAALDDALCTIVGKDDVEIAGAGLSIRGYRILSKLGEGGSSTVYLTERDSDQHQVVLKILNVAAGQDPVVLSRFMQEFDIIASIDHPNIVKIFDHGSSGQNAYIAMEYFPGGALAEIIAGGLSARQAMSLLAQTAAALREIHRRGIIHRDVKPANLMARADGTIALVDFGIAKRIGDNLGRTRHGELFGTPYYLSPEQVLGKPASAQSDIYALGIIFHEMLTGRRPFAADSVNELIAQHVNAPRPRLSAELAECQPLLDRMLAVDPLERYRDADELIDGIDRVWTSIALRAQAVS